MMLRSAGSSVHRAAAARNRPSSIVAPVATTALLRSIFVQCRETPNEDCMMFYAPGYEFLKPRAVGGEVANGGDDAAATMVMTLTVTKENKHISPLARRLFRVDGIDEVTIGQRFVTITRQTEPDLGPSEGEDGEGGETEETEEEARARISLTNTSAIREGKGYATSATPTTPPTSSSSGNGGASSTVEKSTPGAGVKVKEFKLPDEDVKPWEPPHWWDLQFNVCAVIADHAHAKEPTVELDAPHPHADTLPEEGDSEVVLSIKELIATMIRPEIQKDGGDIRFLEFQPQSGEMLVELLGACKTCKSSTTTLADLIERTTRHWIPEVASVVEINQRRKERRSLSPAPPPDGDDGERSPRQASNQSVPAACDVKAPA